MTEEKATEVAGAEMGILDHLRELRKRLVVSIIASLAGAIAAYAFSTQLFELLTAPYHIAFPDQPLIGTGPAEAFLIRVKVAIFGGVILATPIIFAQIWLFVAPGLYSHERKLVIPFVGTSVGLFMAGITLCYKMVIPIAYTFFRAQYQDIGLTPTVKMSEHLSMVITAMMGFGTVFELPLLAFFLGRIGLIDHNTLISGSRYAIVIIFIVAAVLTPPDVVSQLLLAGPLCVLYGLSILVLKYTAKGCDARPITEKD